MCQTYCTQKIYVTYVYLICIIHLKKYCQPDSVTEVFCKKDVLRNFSKLTGKHLRQSLFFGLQLYQKETLAQVLSCEFEKFLRTAFLTEHLFFCSFIHQREGLFFNQSFIYQYIFKFIYLFIFLFFSLIDLLFIYLLAYLFIGLFVYLTILIFTCL